MDFSLSFHMDSIVQFGIFREKNENEEIAGNQSFGLSDIARCDRQ